MSRLAVNLALLTGGEFVGKVLVAVVFAYLGRVLGPSSYGQLEFTLALMFLCTMLADTGLSPFGAREIAKDEASVPDLVAQILVLRCALALGAYAVLAVFVAVIDKPAPLKHFILIYGITLFGLPALLPYVYQGRDQMKYVAAASIIRWSIFAAGVFLLVRDPREISSMPLVEGLAIAGAGVFYFWIRPRGLVSWHTLRQRFDPAAAWSILRRALPIGASEIVWGVKFYFGTVLLGVLIGGAEVGWFAAGLRAVVAIHTFVWLYFFNLLPSMARIAQDQPGRLPRVMQTSLQITAWAGLLVAITGTAFAAPIINLLYGMQYDGSVPVFQALIWIIPLTLISGNYRYALLACDRQHLEFATAAAGAGLTVALTVLLVPRFGLLSATWSMLLSEALVLLLAYVFVRRTVAVIPIWPHVYRPLAAGAAALTVLLLVPAVGPWAWARATLALVVYGLGMPILQPRLISELRAMLSPGKPSDLVGT